MRRKFLQLQWKLETIWQQICFCWKTPFFIVIQWLFSSRHFTFHLCGCWAALDSDGTENATNTCQINITVFWRIKQGLGIQWLHTPVVCVFFFSFIIQNEHQIKDSPVHCILCNRFWCCTHEMRQVRIWLTFWWFILWIVLLFEPFKNDGPLMGVYHVHIIDRTFRYERKEKKNTILKTCVANFRPRKRTYKQCLLIRFLYFPICFFSLSSF